MTAWDQPLATTGATGASTLIAQWRGDRLRFLLALTPEIGLRECVQAHPTVQDTPGPALAFPEIVHRDRLLAALAADAVPQVSALQSDEGGRFRDCVSRYTVALLPETAEAPELDATVWLTLEQIEALARTQGFFTNESRSVLSLVLGLV